MVGQDREEPTTVVCSLITRHAPCMVQPVRSFQRTNGRINATLHGQDQTYLQYRLSVKSVKDLAPDLLDQW